MAQLIRKMEKKSNRCSLFPYEITEVLSLQDAKQRAGWSITAFDLPNVWKSTKGEGTTIAVLDTGCDLNHPDLANNLLPGKNFAGKGKPWDDNQHGTHVTGIICAENNDVGMVGVAPSAKVVPIKVLDGDGNGSLLDVAKGIRWAVDCGGVDLICMSLGAPRPVQQVRKAIQYAAKKGIPCFVAAGTAGKTKEVFYPAAYPETIAIGSIDESFARSGFSNTGKNLDFMAPGNKIFSTVPDDWYAVLSGTSMACPFAVGLAALVLSYVRKQKVNLKLKTVEDYRKAFRGQTIPIKDKRYAGKKFFQGLGIIDPRKFKKWASQNQ